MTWELEESGLGTVYIDLEMNEDSRTKSGILQNVKKAQRNMITTVLCVCEVMDGDDRDHNLDPFVMLSAFDRSIICDVPTL